VADVSVTSLFYSFIFRLFFLLLLLLAAATGGDPDVGGRLNAIQLDFQRREF